MQVDFNNLRIQLARFYNETVLAAQAAQHDGRLERLERPLNDLRDMVVTICALIPEGEKDSVLNAVGEFLVFEFQDGEVIRGNMYDEVSTDDNRPHLPPYYEQPV